MDGNSKQRDLDHHLALDDLKKISEPADREAYNEILAEVCYSLEDYDQALVSYRKVLEFRPDDAELCFSCAVCLALPDKPGEETLQALKMSLEPGFQDFDKLQLLKRLMDTKDYPKFNKLAGNYPLQSAGTGN